MECDASSLLTAVSGTPGPPVPHHKHHHPPLGTGSATPGSMRVCVGWTSGVHGRVHGGPCCTAAGGWLLHQAVAPRHLLQNGMKARMV
jgi:hypothetical protein